MIGYVITALLGSAVGYVIGLHNFIRFGRTCGVGECQALVGAEHERCIHHRGMIAETPDDDPRRYH